ncbi:MAG TPA: hypothetical protein VK866_04295 [Acidimicrobiales bacterium]|nr:hypothetical protein [Acidimicrobiales bacterium]
MTSAAGSSRGWTPVVGAVVARPRLWPVALTQVRRLARPAWWRRPPFLPVPDRAWLRHRLVVAEGDPGAKPSPDEVVAWLEWCRDLPEGQR